MTDPLDDELASTGGYPEEMDLDEEDIDLDDVVPDLNPPNSATGGMIDYLAGIGGFSGQRTSINPFANLQTGKLYDCIRHMSCHKLIQTQVNHQVLVANH